jgi:hypothetical protein
MTTKEAEHVTELVARIFDHAATTCATSHHAARHIIRQLEAAGYEITRLPGHCCPVA